MTEQIAENTQCQNAGNEQEQNRKNQPHNVRNRFNQRLRQVKSREKTALDGHGIKKHYSGQE